MQTLIKRKLISLVILMICVPTLAQENKNQPNLNRFFQDFVLFAGFDVSMPPSNYTGGGGGFYYKMGNNLFLRKNKFIGFAKFTWFRIGIYGGDASGLILTPLNLGFGHQFQLTENFSVSPSISGGPIMGTDDILGPDWQVEWALIPELIFNFGNFRLGLEYSLQREFSNSTGLLKGKFHYIALTLGGNFGKLIHN